MKLASWSTPFVALVALAGCVEEGSNAPVIVPNVAGIWNGTYELTAGTVPAMMTVSQQDRLVGGTIEIVQHLPPSEIIAAIDDFGNVVIVVENGCEEWFGQLFVSDGDKRMEGTLEIDRTQCEDVIGEIGILRVTRP